MYKVSVFSGEDKTKGFSSQLYVVRAEDNKLPSLSRHKKHLEKHPHDALKQSLMSDISDVGEHSFLSHMVPNFPALVVYM